MENGRIHTVEWVIAALKNQIGKLANKGKKSNMGDLERFLKHLEGKESKCSPVFANDERVVSAESCNLWIAEVERAIADEEEEEDDEDME